jgi:hypothetical protein
MQRVFGVLLLVACGGSTQTRNPSAEALPSAPRLGPVTVLPPFESDRPPAFARMKLYENLVAFGFAKDDTTTVTCHAQRNIVPDINFECDIEHDASIQTIGSDADYGDGHSTATDAKVQAALAALGFPAPQGAWPYADDLVITWHRSPADPVSFKAETLVVGVRERTTGAEMNLDEIVAIASPSRVYPRAVILSPSGNALAFVVTDASTEELSVTMHVYRTHVVAANVYIKASERAKTLAERLVLWDKARAARARAR